MPSPNRQPLSVGAKPAAQVGADEAGSAVTATLTVAPYGRMTSRVVVEK